MALLQFTCNVIVTNVLLVAANTFAKKPKWNLFKPKNIITCRDNVSGKGGKRFIGDNHRKHFLLMSSAGKHVLCGKHGNTVTRCS